MDSRDTYVAIYLEREWSRGAIKNLKVNNTNIYRTIDCYRYVSLDKVKTFNVNSITDDENEYETSFISFMKNLSRRSNTLQKCI